MTDIGFPSPRPALFSARANTTHGPPSTRRSTTPAWVLVGLLLGTAGTCLSAYSNIDPDVYWHRVLGGAWLSTRSLGLEDDPISFVAAEDWFPTAWLVEVMYAGVVEAAGWGGIAALRLVLAAAFFLLLGRYVYSAFSPHVAALVLGVSGLPVAWVLQDRPQTFSLVLVALVLPHVARALSDDQLPRWWLVVLMTWFWANLHGLWVIVPALLMLLALIRAIERRDTWWKAAGLAVVSAAAAALTPVGPKLLVSGVGVGRAAGEIAEWGPTTLAGPHVWGLVLAVGALLVLGLAGYRAPARHVLFVLAVSAYGMWASRNAAFAGLLLTPALGAALEWLLPRHLSSLHVPKWAVLGATPALAVAAVGSFAVNAGVPDELPRSLASRLAAEKADVRVVAEYNVAGYLREFGGDGVRVSIDGRSDRYGADVILRHRDMLDGLRGWRARLDRLDPDFVVVHRRSPVREMLTADNWDLIEIDSLYALLRPPQP